MNVLANFFRVSNSYSYDEYRLLVFKFAEDGKTSGDEQLSERMEATKINAQRIKRIDKQIELSNELQEALVGIRKKLTWIVIIETWCGDGAQNIPIIGKMASFSPSIELKIILRDQNPELMNAYLTNGSRSIPKLICIESETEEELGTWGPRPVTIQQMVKDYKLLNPDYTHDELVKNIHLWYAKDKGVAVQREFVDLLTKWSKG